MCGRVIRVSIGSPSAMAEALIVFHGSSEMSDHQRRFDECVVADDIDLSALVTGGEGRHHLPRELEQQGRIFPT